jgi:hypothetical protein
MMERGPFVFPARDFTEEGLLPRNDGAGPQRIHHRVDCGRCSAARAAARRELFGMGR